MEDLLSRFGFPLALALWLLWKQNAAHEKCEKRYDDLLTRIDARTGTFPRLHQEQK